MSIEQKIAELLAESKRLQAAELEEEAAQPTKGAQEPNNAKANDDQTVDGAQDSGVDVTKAAPVNQSAERTAGGGSTKRADTTSGKKPEDAKGKDQAQEISVNVSEDVEALMNGENLSEEFKLKATTIFEAAVLSRVKSEMAKLDEQYQSQLDEQVEQIKEGLIEKVDGYLNYVVEQWMEQNELALESGIKSEIFENFIGRMKEVFVESYIEIPEDKYDVIGDMEETIQTLESKLNEQVESSIEMKKQLDSIKRTTTISEASTGLADTDSEKFKALAEELTFEDEESFKVKLQTIRENYFGKKAATIVEGVVTDEPVQLKEETVLSPVMSAYLKQFQNN
jgi:mRNA-degrading endonuclease RelE of RelBE toxin-antitoxin system